MPPDTQQSTKGFIRETLEFVVIALLIALPIRYFIAQPFIVSGLSMFPTFHNGDYLIVDQITYRFHAPERGDVIVFHNPQQYAEFYIKRIIGLPGEKLHIDGNDVTVYNKDHANGIHLTEPYTGSSRPGREDITLDNSHYFVMGDNRAASSDSRIWGPLDKGLITGRAIARLWPPSVISFFPGKADPIPASAATK